MIHPDPIEADAVKKAVDGTKRADIAAKRARNLDRQAQEDEQEQAFPAEQPTGQRAQLVIDREQRDPGKQSAGGTDVFAEIDVAVLAGYGRQKGQQNDKEQQQQIFKL